MYADLSENHTTDETNIMYNDKCYIASYDIENNKETIINSFDCFYNDL